MEHNRLLLQLEQTRKEINRKTINPEIKTLALSDIKPIVELVAVARAEYVAELLSLATASKGAKMTGNISRLRELRETFEELVAAANALETMIKRGYVDVAGSLAGDV